MSEAVNLMPDGKPDPRSLTQVRIDYDLRSTAPLRWAEFHVTDTTGGWVVTSNLGPFAYGPAAKRNFGLTIARALAAVAVLDPDGHQPAPIPAK